MSNKNLETVDIIVNANHETIAEMLQYYCNEFPDSIKIDQNKLEGSLTIWVINVIIALTNPVETCELCECETSRLKLKLFSKAFLKTTLTLRRLICPCVPSEYEMFVDQFIRGFIGRMSNVGVIRDRDASLGVSICSHSCDWRPYLSEREQLVYEYRLQQVESREYFNDESTSEYLAQHGHFQYLTGENFHCDSIRRIRRRGREKMRAAGYCDLLSQVGEV